MKNIKNRVKTYVEENPLMTGYFIGLVAGASAFALGSYAGGKMLEAQGFKTVRPYRHEDGSVGAMDVRGNVYRAQFPNES